MVNEFAFLFLIIDWSSAMATTTLATLLQVEYKRQRENQILFKLNYNKRSPIYFYREVLNKKKINHQQGAEMKF